MDTRATLNLLSQDAELEAADAFAAPAERGPAADLYPCISHVCAPGGHSVPVLKVLQSNACRNNCYYCAFRAGRDYRRAHLSPDELARSVDLMVRAGVVQGLFLSSGIGDTIKTMDDMLATAELLRGRYTFRGYLHLKLLPGTESDQVARAVELADRVSTNLEAPGDERLAVLAPQKHLEELVRPLRTAAAVIMRLRAAEPAPDRTSGSGYSGDGQEFGSGLVHERWPVYGSPSWSGSRSERAGQGQLGLSTQFVVGPAGETDRELLTTAAWLYRDVQLTRAYYSPFHPISDTPLQDAPPTDAQRQHRLYQADWLLRFYSFGVEELPFGDDGRLSTTMDPKLAWARRHPERFPIEVNQVPLSELLRVPGIGPVSARAIAQARRLSALRTLGDLRRLGALAERAAPFVLLAGKRPPHQIPLPLEG
jgi:predicted DNA-binding helix-hairpin-helix protein